MVGSTRAPKAYEKHAWIIFLILSIFLMLFALASIGVGGPPDASYFGPHMTWQEVLATRPWEEVRATRPGIMPLIGLGNIARGLGIILLGFSIFAMAIAAVPFRRGERWAWVVSWYWPVLFGALLANGVLESGDLRPPQVGLMIISLLGLLLPFRRFFPKRAGEETQETTG